MTARRAYVIALVVVALGAIVGAAQASSRFSNRTLDGSTYGFSGSGTLFGGTVQAAIAGLNSFHRDDGCTVTGRLNVGGAVYSVRSVSCEYRVHPDGTGWLNVVLTGAPFTLPPFRSDFVIVDNAKEIQFVLSDAAGSTVASGVSKRQTGGE